MDSLGVRLASNLGIKGGSRQEPSVRPGGDTIISAVIVSSRARRLRTSGGNKISREGGTWSDTQLSFKDKTISGTSTGGCRACNEGELIAATEIDARGSRLSEEEERRRRVSVLLTCRARSQR
jgi:hypothetical protein